MSSSTPRQSVEYKYIKPSEILPILKTNGLWYLHETVQPLLSPFDPAWKEEQTELVKETKTETLRLFANALDNGEVLLGERPEYFNDNDRWHPLNRRYEEKTGMNSKVEKDHPDTVVVHHTATAPDISLKTLNALGLLRLYLPECRKGFPTYTTPQAVCSGHFRERKQVFFGYHWLVWRDGSTTQLLKDEYTGFHAGDYAMNCRSTGIALVGDFTDKNPSAEAMEALLLLIRKYHPDKILGHGEVVRTNGKPVKTECPGKSFYGETGWKKILERVQRLA